MPSRAARYDWIDAVKGLAIILVVFGHAWRGCQNAGLFEDMPAWLFAAVDDRIYAFHMPLFFLLSGLFLVPGMARRSPSAFLASRVTRLLYPMVLWTYIFAGSKVLAGQLANAPLPLAEIPAFPIPGHWQYWFLWALFLLHLGVLLLRPLLLSERFGRAALWGLLGASLLLQVVHLPPALGRWTNYALNFLPYLSTGMLLGAYGLLRPLGRAAGLGMSGLFLVTLILVPYLADAGIPKVVYATILSVSVLGSLSWLAGRFPRPGAVLAMFGAASMIIFLSHTFFSAGLRIGLIAGGVTALPLHLAAGLAVGLVLPLLLKRVADRSGRAALIGA